MTVSAAVPADHPLRVAWDAYKLTDEYANTLKWATHPEHAQGSLWAAFAEGFSRAQATESALAVAEAEAASWKADAAATHLALAERDAAMREALSFIPADATGRVQEVRSILRAALARLRPDREEGK